MGSPKRRTSYDLSGIVVEIKQSQGNPSLFYNDVLPATPTIERNHRDKLGHSSCSLSGIITL